MPQEQVLVEYNTIPRPQLIAMLHGAMKVAEREEEKVKLLMELYEKEFKNNLFNMDFTPDQIETLWQEHKVEAKIDFI